MFLLVPAYAGSPGQKAVKRVCVCVCVCKSACVSLSARRCASAGTAVALCQSASVYLNPSQSEFY